MRVWHGGPFYPVYTRLSKGRLTRTKWALRISLGVKFAEQTDLSAAGSMKERV